MIVLCNNKSETQTTLKLDYKDVCQTVGMNELDTYIRPNIRLINPIFKRFKNNRSYIFDELSTWVEHSQDQLSLYSSSHIRVPSCLSDIFLRLFLPNKS